jgi:hypothetical protein
MMPGSAWKPLGQVVEQWLDLTSAAPGQPSLAVDVPYAWNELIL